MYLFDGCRTERVFTGELGFAEHALFVSRTTHWSPVVYKGKAARAVQDKPSKSLMNSSNKKISLVQNILAFISVCCAGTMFFFLVIHGLVPDKVLWILVASLASTSLFTIITALCMSTCKTSSSADYASRVPMQISQRAPSIVTLPEYVEQEPSLSRPPSYKSVSIPTFHPQ
jgi:hypothetical protein